jgi:O-antigen ligase
MDRFDPSRFKTLLFQMFTLMFIISLVTAVALPGRGRETASAEGSALANVGAWKGPYRQKNELGLNCALAFALCAGYRPKSSIERTWRTGLVLLTLLLSYKSQSRESWIAIAVICYLAVLIKPIRGLAPASRLPVVITLVVGAVTTVTLAYMNLDALLALVGRDRTLTGRSDIWNYSMIAAQRRPLLGYGIYGYWTTPNATEVVVRAGWKVTSSHNSYLDCVISYGLIGLMIYLPIPLSALAYIFRAILSYSIENLEMYIYMLTAIIVLSFGGGFLTLTPGISYVLAIYVISNLEKVERSGFMSLEP